MIREGGKVFLSHDILKEVHVFLELYPALRAEPIAHPTNLILDFVDPPEPVVAKAPQLLHSERVE